MIPKNFNIKPKVIGFSSTKFTTDLEKAKLYVAWVKFLNNHFKFNLFTKGLYQHISGQKGFIAHYNIYGFYGEYFETATSFHFNVNGYTTPMHECMGNVNRKSTLSRREQFFNIFDEIQNGKGIGEFTDKILEFRYGHEDYADLNRAMRNALTEYICCWTDMLEKESEPLTKEIAKAEPKVAFIKEAPMETKTVIVDEQPLKTGQASIVDFFDLGGVA